MSTYLLAIVITDYQYVEPIYKKSDRVVQMRFWGPSEELPKLNETMSAAPGMLNYLESYLRQPFTLPKLDFIAIPKFLDFIAMENWGLITFK